MRQVRVVLIADDNQDMLESMVVLLGFDGYTVLTASNGTDAFDIASRERPDAVVLDLGMPGRNGRDVAQSIRQEAWGSKVLLIALTGWSDAKHDPSFAGHFDHVLIKPSSPEELSALLASRPPQ